MIKEICLIVLLLTANCINSQITIYQDSFRGGVTGDAFNPWTSNSPGQFDVHIEPGSSIRKAILFVNAYFDPEDDGVVDFSGTLINVNQLDAINSPYFVITTSYTREIRTLLVDVTNSISPSQNTYPIDVVQPISGGLYCEFYLYIAYENPLLNTIEAAVFANDVQPNAVMDYYIQNISAMDTSNNVALAIHTSAMCDTTQDGSFIVVEADTIGLIGEDDENSPVTCNGVSANFYYQNNTLYGLGNDVANNTMMATDAIANIESYIVNTNSLNMSFLYQSPQTINGLYTNPVHQLFLSYTTPCDTFTVNLQDSYTVCNGDSVQLQLSGGIDWEWEATSANPNTGLSCYNCASPWFKDTVSRWYTVRVWNNDSCSKVLPVYINVVDNPLPPALQVNTTNCSDSTGSIAVQVQNATHSYSIDGNLPQSSPMFSNLHADTYQITITDTNGCSSTTNALVNQVYPIAQFTANPQQGDVPLNVQFTNQSTGATNYIWHIANDTLNTVNPSYLFTNAGTFSATLIAYDTYPLCADTSSLQVYTEHPFVVIAPSIHLKGNVYEIYTSGVSSLEYQLYNAIGQLVKQKNFIPANGNNFVWSANNLSRGMYVYRIIAKDMDGNKKEYKGKVVVQ